MILKLIYFIQLIKRNIFIQSMPFAILVVIIYLIYLPLFNMEGMRKEVEEPAFRYLNAWLSDKDESFSEPNIFIFEVNNEYLKARKLIDDSNSTNNNYGYFFPRKYIIEFIENVDKLVIKPKYLLIDYNLNYSSCSPIKLSKDDRRLIELLNNSNRSYTIFIPHDNKYNFLDSYITSKKVVFCSTNFPKNSDGITRRFESYDTINDRNFTNIALLLSDNNVSDYKKYHVIENRILFKKRVNNSSYWNNITYYSNFLDMHRMIPTKYENAIILFGANYKDSNDIHKVKYTLWGEDNINGVEVIANSVMSLFYFDNKLSSLEPFKVLLISFLYAFLAKIMTSLIVQQIIFLKKYETIMSIIILLIMSTLFSYYIFIHYSLWFNYLVPSILWSIYNFTFWIKEKYYFIKNKEK